MKITLKLLAMAAVIAALFLYISACAGNGEGVVTNPPPNGGGSNVSVIDDAFSPQSLTVQAGTMVMWRNNGNSQHTVTSGDPNNAGGVFDSGLLGNGATFQHMFNDKGTFPYFCRVHGSIMSGTIVVQ